MDEVSAEVAATALILLKKILIAICVPFTPQSVFNPLWISNRNKCTDSLEKHAYITKIVGSNRTWVCVYCFKSRTGIPKLEKHLSVCGKFI